MNCPLSALPGPQPRDGLHQLLELHLGSTERRAEAAATSVAVAAAIFAARLTPASCWVQDLITASTFLDTSLCSRCRACDAECNKVTGR